MMFTTMMAMKRIYEDDPNDDDDNVSPWNAHLHVESNNVNI